jgi:hypothetical protein
MVTGIDEWILHYEKMCFGKKQTLDVACMRSSSCTCPQTSGVYREAHTQIPRISIVWQSWMILPYANCVKSWLPISHSPQQFV